MTVRRLLTFCEVAMYCLAASALFSHLKVPAASLLGSLFAASVAGWLGRPVDRVLIAKSPAIACVGLFTGLSLSPDVFGAALAWPISFIGLAVTTIAITATNYWLFQRGGGGNRETSFYASVPGALSAVLILAEDTRADLKRVLFAQLSRVFALLSIAPFYFSSGSIAPTPDAGTTGAAGGLLQWGLVVLVSALFWIVLATRRIALAPFLGPLVGAGALSLLGLVSLEAHPIVVKTASGALGMIVGARLGSAKLKVGLKFAGLSVLALLVAILLGFTAGAFFGLISGVGAVSGVLAFSPGSMELMVALGVSLDANVAYIVFHHLVRVLGLMVVLPFLHNYLRNKQ